MLLMAGTPAPGQHIQLGTVLNHRSGHCQLSARDTNSAMGSCSLPSRPKWVPSLSQGTDTQSWTRQGVSLTYLSPLRPQTSTLGVASCTQHKSCSLLQNCNAIVPAARGDQGQLSISPSSSVSQSRGYMGMAGGREGGQTSGCSPESQLSLM